MTEPLRFEFTVGCTAIEAFEVRTQRISMWWPIQHTRSRERGTTVVIEPKVGGQIFERTSAGREFQWGSVTAWDPPQRFGYRSHITSPPDEATNVEVRFSDNGNGTTRVTIEHSGFERLGPDGPARREGNQRYWERLIPEFVKACNRTRTA